MGKLEGKVALITGATAGIGSGILHVFTDEGAKVVFCGRREDKGRALETEYRAKGKDVTFIKADMTKDEDVEALFAETMKVHGRLDILVNNAGMLRMNSITEMNVADEWDKVIALDLRSYFIAIRHAVKVMENGGAIVNMASIGGLGGCPMLASYGAAKAGVVNLTKSCGVELAPKGIRVNAICPGTIYSEMMPRDGAFTAMTIPKIPLGRAGEPEEIGMAAAFLASSEASYITGTTLVVDGGMTAS